jgi:hypothetical protein
MEFPDGTDTVLAHGDRPAPADLVASHGGTRLRNGVLAFRSAAQAVRCAIDLEELGAAPIGLHAGEVVGGRRLDGRAKQPPRCGSNTSAISSRPKPAWIA